jgi:hypothetical protein
MNNRVCSQLRYFALLCFLTLQCISMTSWAQATCYSTPQMAIVATGTSSLFPAETESSGYRVSKIQADPVLGQRWGMITRCDHPEWPAFALPANGASSLRARQEVEHSLIEGVRTAPVVRTGDIVRLWRQESFLRIEVAGVSEDSGGLGKTIRVRLLRRNTDDQSIPEQFFGVVRGPSNVEIQP